MTSAQLRNGLERSCMELSHPIDASDTGLAGHTGTTAL
jgi:hypothetical protein